MAVWRWRATWARRHRPIRARHRKPLTRPAIKHYRRQHTTPAAWAPKSHSTTGPGQRRGIFFLAMIDFDLPTVKIDLQQRLDGTGEIGRQQIRRIAVIHALALGLVVGRWRNYNHPQRARLGAALPQYALDFFIANLAALAAIENLGGLKVPR